MRRNITLTCALLACTSQAALSAPVIYDDMGAFIVETQPQVLENFDDVPHTEFSETSATVGALTFSGPIPNTSAQPTTSVSATYLVIQ